jgi:hypothetical protein
MENFDCFQVYSFNNGVNILVDKMWIKDKRIFFRVLEELEPSQKYFKKENESKIYSINADSLYSIRCRLYF